MPVAERSAGQRCVPPFLEEVSAGLLTRRALQEAVS